MVNCDPVCYFIWCGRPTARAFPKTRVMLLISLFMREVVISAIYPLNMTLSAVILLMGEMQISCGHCQPVVIQCIGLFGCPFLLIPLAVISILNFKLWRVEKGIPLARSEIVKTWWILIYPGYHISGKMMFQWRSSVIPILVESTHRCITLFSIQVCRTIAPGNLSTQSARRMRSL